MTAGHFRTLGRTCPPGWGAAAWVGRVGTVAVVCLSVALVAWYVSPLRRDSSSQASTTVDAGNHNFAAASVPNSAGPILYLVPQSTLDEKLPASRAEMEASGLKLVASFDELKRRAATEQPLAVLVDRDVVESLGKAEAQWATERFQEGVAIVGIRIAAAELARYVPVSKELAISQMGPFKEGRVFFSLVYSKRSAQGDLCQGAMSDYLDRNNAARALKILTRAIATTAACDPRNPSPGM